MAYRNSISEGEEKNRSSASNIRHLKERMYWVCRILQPSVTLCPCDESLWQEGHLLCGWGKAVKADQNASWPYVHMLATQGAAQGARVRHHGFAQQTLGHCRKHDRDPGTWSVLGPNSLCLFGNEDGADQGCHLHPF